MACFTLAALLSGNNLGTNGTGGWVAPTANVHFCRKEESFISSKIQTPDGPAHTLVTIPTMSPLLQSERSSVKIVPVSLLCELHGTLISTF